MEKREEFLRDFLEEFNKVLVSNMTFDDLKPKEKIQMLEFADRMFKRGWFKICKHGDKIMPRSKCFCGGCGEPIMWMTTETGKMMPVNWDIKLDMVEKFDAAIMVTHFATCKNANDFRKKKVRNK